MADYRWPSKADATLIGKSHTKLDAVVKSTGEAKYAYDVNPPRMLLARAYGCPHAHCTIVASDFAAAKAVPGVVDVMKSNRANWNTVNCQGELLAYVVGETEGAVAEGLKALKFTYQQLDVFVDDRDLAAAQAAGRAGAGGGRRGGGGGGGAGGGGGNNAAFEGCDVVIEGDYGLSGITHCCLEPHGSTAEFQDGKLISHISSQNITGVPGQISRPTGIPAGSITGHCDYIGGGFGSKFTADYWCADAALLSRKLGRPVKLMLDRDTELKIAGSRPSGWAKVKIGADKTGLIKAFDAHVWSTGGYAGGALGATAPIPYVFTGIPGASKSMTAILTNTGPQRAWRAPNHPQSNVLSQTAIDDIAGKLGLDSYDVFAKNMQYAAAGRRATYLAEMQVAADLMDWKKKWHAHGKGEVKGSIVSGLGMAIHTWQGGTSAMQAGGCRVKIDADGNVEAFVSVQDLGTGSRTVIGIVVAETMGLPLDRVTVHIGNSQYPGGPSSGGSITVASVSNTSRRAAVDALNKLNESVAKKLECSASSLVAKGGKVFSSDAPDKGLSWKDACATLGMNAVDVTTRFANPPATSAGVAGVQMAEVEVDKATGVVRMKKFVAVQDCGLIINRKTAISQINGAMIMGICTALFEERIMDKTTGAFLNAELSDYKLARLGDTGEFVVEIYEPDSERNRGVIGLGEPPAISPGAAISNAVANALGVRVPYLPMTPKAVLEALAKAPKTA